MQSTETRTGVHIKFIAQPGQGDALAAHLREAANETKSEAGTLLWFVAQSPTEPDTVWVTEVYASKEAKIAHESTPAYTEAKAKTAGFLGGAPEVFPLISPEGKGLA